MNGILSRGHNHVDKARSILKTLLAPEMLLHPSSNGEERFLTAEMSGSYAGLMRLTIDKNKDGGGQAIQPSLAALLRFEIHWACLGSLKFA